MNKALYDLKDVQDCIRSIELNNGKIIYSAPRKSYVSVVETFEKIGKDISIEEASKFIEKVLLGLKNSDFCEVGDFYGEPADVYGKRFDGICWYIKFSFDSCERVVYEISFHEAKFSMATVNGHSV